MTKTSKIVKNDQRRAIVVRRTTCPSNRCSTTTVPGRRSRAPVTASVSPLPATSTTGVRIRTPC